MFHCDVNAHCTAIGFPLHSRAWLWGLVRSGIDHSKNSSQRCSVELEVRTVQETRDLPLQPWKSMRSWTLLCAQWHCDAGTSLGHLVPVKANLNVTACKYILRNFLLPSLGQKSPAWVWYSNVHKLYSLYHCIVLYVALVLSHICKFLLLH